MEGFKHEPLPPPRILFPPVQEDNCITSLPRASVPSTPSASAAGVFHHHFEFSNFARATGDPSACRLGVSS